MRFLNFTFKIQIGIILPFSVVILFLTNNTLAYAQEPSQEGAFNYSSELNKMVAIPNSPEAQAFTRYGDVQVNLHEGSPNVSIPLYTYKGAELNLPISLTYDIHARKVEDMATNVGLGWNLNLGGRVSRISKGNPDDYIEAGGRYMTLMNPVLRDSIVACKAIINDGYNFNSEAQLDDFFNFIKDIQKGNYDTEVDYYSVNVMGISDYITMDMEDFDPHALDNPNLKVNLTRGTDSWFYGDGETLSGWYPIDSWHIVDGQGNEYYFELSEVTISEHENDISSYPFAYHNEYSSSWVLTKVISKNQKDIYEFEYTNFGFWSQFNDFPVSKIITTPEYNTTINNYPISSGQEIQSNTRYKIKQQHLTQVKHNGNIIVNINLKDRLDYNANQDSAIDYIQILEPIHQQPIQHYEFKHSYFGISENTNPSTVSFKDIRLKLDTIKIAGSDYNFSSDFNFQKSYVFNYTNSNNFPSRTSSAQDALGFYNGQSSSLGILYPQVVSGNFTFAGANRDFSEEHAKIGILESIEYPTGGLTSFEYEQHQEKAYEETEQITQVASIVAYSDEENQALCGNCCLEAGQSEISDGTHETFQVTEQGEYDFLFLNDSGGLTTNTGRKAFVIGPYPTASSVPQVTIDDFLCGTNPITYFRTFEGNHNNNLTERHTLSPGYYKVFVYNLDLESPNIVVGESPTERTMVGLTVHKVNYSTTIQTKYYPGLRIKSITNYSSEDDTNSITSKKNYLYKKNYSSPISEQALKVNYTPILSYFLPKEELLVNDTNPHNFQFVTVQSLHRLAKPIVHSGSNIIYRYVIEEQENISEESTTGYPYVRHEFEHIGLKGFVPTGLSGATSYFGNFKKGKTKKQQIYSTQGIKTETTTNYIEANVFSTSSFSIASKSDRNLKFVTYYTKGSGEISFFYQHGVNGGFNGETVSGSIYQPDNCTTPPNFKCLPDTSPSMLDFKFTAASGKTGAVSETTKTTHYPSENIVEHISSIYSSVDDGFLLKQTSTTNSNGNTLISSYEYPRDLTSEDPIYSQMINDNQLMHPIKTTLTYNNFKTQVLKNNYINLNPGFYISNVQSAKNSAVISPDGTSTPELSTNNPLEDRIHYEYYPNGTIKSSYQSAETDNQNNTTYSNLSTYIWGYNNSQLVAKIDNASYAEVQSYVNNIQVKSDLDNDHCRAVTCKEEELRMALNTLRIALPNALVTTYTYDPMIGVTSITDPRGQTQYFEYDALHRLKQVKDNEDNILSKNQYNYRTQN